MRTKETLGSDPHPVRKMIQSVSKGLRPHIVLAGPVNAGKSTLFNRLLGQTKALVSSAPGTTTDAVSQPFELPDFGPVVFVDAPGFEDFTRLGVQRGDIALRTLRDADLILFLCDFGTETMDLIRSKSSALILPLFTRGTLPEKEAAAAEKTSGHKPILVGGDLTELYGVIARMLREKAVDAPGSITGDLVKEGDIVLLVMPQDSEAPKGRLILPQVQTLRELLDKHCITLSVRPSGLSRALASLKEPPSLIITDSQKFPEVERLCPPGVPLTSFSILMSAYKGDLKRLIDGAEALDSLTAESRVLIAEACAHAPNSEDIGTVKIPRLLRRRFGEGLRIDHVSGKDFPTDLSDYDLVIHCGACMFNRAHLLSRQGEAEGQGIPMTNYGIAIAKLTGILHKVALPQL